MGFGSPKPQPLYKIMKILFTILLIASPLQLLANHLYVTTATVTEVRAYETSDGSTNVFIGVNNNSRVGPNPNNTSVNCELWTFSKDVLSIALTAKASGQKVKISYVPREDTGDEFCKVRSFALREY